MLSLQQPWPFCCCLADIQHFRCLLVLDASRLVVLIISELPRRYASSDYRTLTFSKMPPVEVSGDYEPKGITTGIGSEVFFLGCVLVDCTITIASVENFALKQPDRFA